MDSGMLWDAIEGKGREREKEIIVGPPEKISELISERDSLKPNANKARRIYISIARRWLGWRYRLAHSKA